MGLWAGTERKRVWMWVYSSLLAGVLVVGAPFWAFRMATSGRYRAGLRGRLGRIPEGLRRSVEGRQVIWVHAVSVGEVLAAEGMVGGLEAALGAGWVVVISTTTEAGQRLARGRFGEERVFYLPLDFAWAVRRYLRALRPRMLVLMESELWPRMLVEAERAGVPVAVANARVSDRSYPRYMRLRRLWRPLLEKVRLFLAQGVETAQRLVAIGAAEARVTGNLKYDFVAGGDTVNVMVGMVRERLLPEMVVVVCGSTLEGEEKLLLEAWRDVLRAEPRAVMVLAPRHTDRFERVLGMVRESGFGMVRATEFAGEGQGLGAGTVLVLDTIGDLASMYGLATVAFVGGSLVEAGGHNPLEPASFGAPVVIGSSFNNFREIVETMRAKNGIRVVSRAGLADTLVELVQDRPGARLLGENGRAVFAEEAGGTKRTVTALLELLGDAGRAAGQGR